MKYECCSKENVEYEIKTWLSLKNNEVLKIELTNCPVLKGTFDLHIVKEKMREKRKENGQ
jgi:hypothetical protein